jgi:hypothetical protein
MRHFHFVLVGVAVPGFAALPGAARVDLAMRNEGLRDIGARIGLKF